MAPTLNIAIEQGSRFERKIRRRDVNGNLVDMTGWIARGHLRRRKTDRDPIVQFHLDLEVDPDTGDPNRQLAWWLTALETAALAPGPYFYDIELVPHGVEADAERVLQGVATVSAEVTRD